MSHSSCYWTNATFWTRNWKPENNSRNSFGASKKSMISSTFQNVCPIRLGFLRSRTTLTYPGPFPRPQRQVYSHPQIATRAKTCITRSFDLCHRKFRNFESPRMSRIDALVGRISSLWLTSSFGVSTPLISRARSILIIDLLVREAILVENLMSVDLI